MGYVEASGESVYLRLQEFSAQIVTDRRLNQDQFSQHLTKDGVRFLKAL